MTEQEHDAWQDGFDCAWEGGRLSANPHPSYSPLHKAWADGFAAGLEARQ